MSTVIETLSPHYPRTGVIYYPESDGKPMGETDLHRSQISYCVDALDIHFRNEPEVYVSGNIMFYYAEGDPHCVTSPDVMFVRGVNKSPRRIYKLWVERQFPQVIIEISSRKTFQDDFNRKWRLYERLGAEEYYIFDPEYSYLATPLMAFQRNANDELEECEVVNGRIYSPTLRLELVDTGRRTLRFFNPHAGQFLLTAREEHEARELAELNLRRTQARLEAQNKELAEERAAREQAEAELAALRALLAEKQ